MRDKRVYRGEEGPIPSRTLTPSLLGTMQRESGLARGTTLVARTAAWPRHGLEEEASWPRGIVPYCSRRTARHLAGLLRNLPLTFTVVSWVTDFHAALFDGPARP